MAVAGCSLNMSCAPTTTSATWRTRSLILVLMTVIAMYFWVESRYPALMKRYHAGTQIKFPARSLLAVCIKWTRPCRICGGSGTRQ